MTIPAKKARDLQKAANRHASSAIASMRDDLDALHHAEECNGTAANGKPCKRGSEVKRGKLKDGTKYTQDRHNNPEAWHDEDQARQVIEDGHYGIQVRGDWHSPGEQDSEASEYIVILGGGGPAMRVTGDLDRGQPTSARYEYQDWFTSWTKAETTREQDKTLLEWVSILYFGE
jgi:hypothetical protein